MFAESCTRSVTYTDGYDFVVVMGGGCILVSHNVAVLNSFTVKI
jgi:hypothetical protein